MTKLFMRLPDNFFAPLAFGLKEHYAELLEIYYKRFLEFPAGVEKELLIADFQDYLESVEADVFSDSGTFDNDSGAQDASLYGYEKNPRGYSHIFLRRLVRCGWITEEDQPDFSVRINISVNARPFLEAIHSVMEGDAVEYESHIIGIHSSLCNKTSAKENGHLAVMNALRDTRKLIDSLKVLSQNIKTHIQEIYDHSGDIRDILHIHYDLYMDKIVDRAYNRLKTSDNLSRYRPEIFSAISGFLDDEAWLEKSSSAYSMIKNQSRETSRRELINMLHEIRNDLRSLDPMITEIDDKNRRYSGISTEKIKSSLYSDTSLESRTVKIISALKRGAVSPEETGIRISSIKFVDSHSIYHRRRRIHHEHFIEAPVFDTFEAEMAETELRLRLSRQLNPARIREYLDSLQTGGIVAADKIDLDMESFVRLIYAGVYAESRVFPYKVEWFSDDIEINRFRFKKHRFVRR